MESPRFEPGQRVRLTREAVEQEVYPIRYRPWVREGVVLRVRENDELVIRLDTYATPQAYPPGLWEPVPADGPGPAGEGGNDAG